VAIRQPSTLDPQQIKDPAGILLTRQIFEPLLNFDPQTLQLREGLADKWESRNGGAQFIFHLRDKSKFHDGRPVKAEDVRFSLNRLARQDTGSEAAFLMDAVKGFGAVNASGSSDELEGVKVVDDSTVEISLRFPWHEFPYVLTSPATSILSRQEVLKNAGRFSFSPAGTGPYQLVDSPKRGQDFTLRAFPGYAGPKPRIARVTFLVYEDPAAAWKDFEAGLLDVTEVPPGQIDLARAKYGLKGFSPAAAGVYLGFNLSRVPDPRVREAISRAVNRKSLAHEIYDDVLISADSLAPPAIPGSKAGSCGSDCGFDVAGAKALVKQAYPDAPPPSLDLWYQSGGPQEETARALQQSLREIGVALALKPKDLPEFFKGLDNHQADIFRLGWAGDYPLADWFLGPLFMSTSKDNYSGLSSQAVDSLIQQARSEPNRDRRRTLYEALEKADLDSVSVVPLGFFRNHFAASRRVTDFYADRLGGFQVSRFGLHAAG